MVRPARIGNRAGAGCQRRPHRKDRVNMKLIAVLSVFLAGAGLYGQSSPSSDDARQSYALVKPSLIRAAEKMPEEYYSFRTVPEVRTFAEMIAHVADGQLLMCGVVKG